MRQRAADARRRPCAAVPSSREEAKGRVDREGRQHAGKVRVSAVLAGELGGNRLEDVRFGGVDGLRANLDSPRADMNSAVRFEPQIREPAAAISEDRADV